MKGLLYSILICIALAGCASGPELSEEEEKVLISTCRGKGLSNPNTDACLFAERASMIDKKKVELEYERQVRRDVEEDKIRALVEWCKAQPSMSILYQGPHSIKCSSRNKRRNAPLCIPRHARRLDYQCANTQEIMRAIERQMRGGF